MKKSKYPIYHQILSINKEGNQEYIRTGATLNDATYISLPVILAMYGTSDPTLRKYIKDYGTIEDSFLADGRLFIKEQFLKQNGINLKNNNTSTYHPYKKGMITGAKLPYVISSNQLNQSEKISVFGSKIDSKDDKKLIVEELKKQNWDYFITINSSSTTKQDYWDLTMLKFIDQLAEVVGDPGVLGAYSTEFNYEKPDDRTKLVMSNHRHLHLLLKKNAKSIQIKTIKGLLLSSMGRKSFRKNEFHISMYDKSMWATTYILKQYKSNRDCFSMVSPRIN
jgi:hypothetical protein